MGELRNKCVANIPDWWSNYTVCPNPCEHNYQFEFSRANGLKK